MQMKINVISTTDNIYARYTQACLDGFITFIYRHADPKEELLSIPFMYVDSDEELNMKIKMLSGDISIIMELYRKLEEQNGAKI